MSRTYRKHDPKLRANVASNINEIDRDGPWLRHSKRILRGNDGALSYDKCQTARIDGEGGWKLDTWSESPSKHNDAHRKRRAADKILTQRQLEDM